jgi:hypothetical protein
MSRLEQSPEESTQVDPITDPEKLEALRKSLKKRFENITVDNGAEDYYADKLHHTLEKTPDEFIEKGIEGEIH